MERTVTVKKWYVVTGTAGATVTSPDGSKTFCTVPEGGQGTFYATTPKVVTSDDSVEVVEATFNLAPVKLKLLGLLGGGASTLPSGYLSAEFLESTSTGDDNVASYFKLPINAKSPEDDLVIETEHFMAKTPSVLQIEGLGEDTCTYCIGYSVLSNSGFSAFDGVKNSQDGNIRRDVNIFFDWRFGEWANYKLELLKAAVRVSVNGEEKASFIPNWNNDNNTRKYLGCFGRFNNDSTYTTYGMYGRKRKYKAYVNGEKKYDLIPAISDNGKPCFYNRVDKKAYYNEGASYFIVGMNNEQARKLGRLPAGGGTLKVSLPSNYLEDEGVTNAIANANAKDWNIEVASTFEADGASTTFALRRIWVRKTLDERGNYIDSDGVRWQVESCVAMYNADGSEPDAHGYEPFRSVEAAVNYWGLTAWVDPDAEEELLTDTENE